MKKLLKFIIFIVCLAKPIFSSVELVISGVPYLACEESVRHIKIKNLNEFDTVGKLKEKIYEYSGLAPENQQLFFSGQEYGDDVELGKIEGINELKSVVLHRKYTNS